MKQSAFDMTQSAFDSWLTTQSDEPFHFNFDVTSPNYSWCINNVQNGQCECCKTEVGIILTDTSETTSGYFNNYYQLDIDGEQLLCDECYETLNLEIGETK
jgi:hypothetical protein